MIIDEYGLPRDNGASDKQDSARLAGIMTVFHYPTVVTTHKYVVLGKNLNTIYVRHPKEVIYNFSRDQALCLMAGLAEQGHSGLVNKEYITGVDIFSPAHNGHVARCQAKEASLLQAAWLWIDVVYSCYVTPLSEPNQLLCMLMMADEVYLRFWLKHNKQWRKAIRDYWCENEGAWRGERDLAEHMIKQLEEYL